MDLAKARAEGIALFTHKSSEGNTYLDPNFANAMDRAGPVNFPVAGAYHVLWPGNPLSQADDWFLKVDTYCSWWRDHPCWIWQIDAELFQNFKPYRQPSVAEINTCGDRIVARAGCKPSQVVVYAPEWLYGDTLGGLKYRCLWASNYAPGSGGFKQLYPGDSSSRWHSYSGITPTILQYTSNATIAGQAPADASAIRVTSEADLQALFLGDPDMPLTDAEWTKLTGIVHTEVQAGVVDTLQGVPGQVQVYFQGHLPHTISVDSNNQALSVVSDDELAAAVQTILNAIAAIPTGGATAFDITSTGTLTPRTTP
jgi:hypothetical protein